MLAALTGPRVWASVGQYAEKPITGSIVKLAFYPVAPAGLRPSARMTARQARIRTAARILALALCLLLAASLGAFAATGHSPAASQDSPAGPSASEPLSPAVDQFLNAYVRPDGRVWRPDQDGDTVSEGQAYGLLLAEAAGQDGLFGRIWQWTQGHLQLPDGLFAWHADAAGHVLDPGSASDADLLIAWALLRYQGPGAAPLHQDGSQVASAVLAHEVTAGPGGTPVLAAGPWATGDPATLDPSYWSLPALTGLARLTGNQQWLQIADGAVALTARLTRNGALLPPDWAGLDAGGAVYPDSAQYGLDAERTVVWFAASCVPQARTLAARWWRLLRLPRRASALALTLNGAVINPAANALPFVAAAAAADAAAAPGASHRLLSQAASQQQRHPGYYGGAWAALGPTLLTSNALNGC
jgi:endoglucanase